MRRDFDESATRGLLFLANVGALSRLLLIHGYQLIFDAALSVLLDNGTQSVALNLARLWSRVCS